ncbi:hypothetical protein F4777DRAFT_92073 [Nemania sp. FL0916]|nr:hypothetical protein F4777DRAFT_92073 [Nemania sp. FL0916]
MNRSMQNTMPRDPTRLSRQQIELQIAKYNHAVRYTSEADYQFQSTTRRLRHKVKDALTSWLIMIIPEICFRKRDDYYYVPKVNPLQSPARTASPQVPKIQQTRPCEACLEQKHPSELCRAPCQHEYCGQCLSSLFRCAMTDESLFPPQCCKQPIPLDKSRSFLDPNLVEPFQQKALEFSTPNRTYCHNTNCAAFIPPANCSYTTATCGKCRKQTCTTCKGASHDRDCPSDEQLQQALQLARQEGWQRCQNCSTMVELNFGCNHITCRCGHHFCYVCGAKWKTCACSHWDEHRLYEQRANYQQRQAEHQQRQAEYQRQLAEYQRLAEHHQQRAEYQQQQAEYQQQQAGYHLQQAALQQQQAALQQEAARQRQQVYYQQVRELYQRIQQDPQQFDELIQQINQRGALAVLQGHER